MRITDTVTAKVDMATATATAMKIVDILKLALIMDMKVTDTVMEATDTVMEATATATEATRMCPLA